MRREKEIEANRVLPSYIGNGEAANRTDPPVSSCGVALAISRPEVNKISIYSPLMKPLDGGACATFIIHVLVSTLSNSIVYTTRASNREQKGDFRSPSSTQK